MIGRMKWPDLARRQSGAITRVQLRAAGCADTTITRLVSRGLLERQERGVLFVTGAPVTYSAQLWVAVLATGGTLGFATAAHLWDMAGRPSLIDVVVGTRRRVRPRFGVRAHHVFVPAGAVTTIEGLPVTARAWTLLDHLGRLSLPAAVRLADRALQQRWLARDDFLRRVGEYPGRQGNRIIRALVAATDSGAAAQSERTLHRLLRRAGIRGWQANYQVVVAGRVAAVIDVAFLRRRLAVEVDGFAYHSDVERFERDRHRQNSLVSMGWTVLRFTWHDLVDRPQYVIRTIQRHLG